MLDLFLQTTSIRVNKIYRIEQKRQNNEKNIET